MTLQWSEDLAIGHQEIDRQHRELIEHFNAFLDACNERRGKEQLNQLFEFLDQYVIEHFRQEELLMMQNNYPEILPHQREHREFTTRLAELRRELAKSGPTITVLIHTNKALLYWLTTHIKQIDIQLSRFLKPSGSD